MRRASNRNVMAWTFMGNTRMHQVLREKGNKLSHVGIFTFEVSADGTISETGTAVSTILPYVKKWPHIKWLLTIMNHGTASIFTALRENTDDAQDTFISEIVRIIDKYPWCSGIDIDLERGGELANRAKANALFSRIYSTVKAKGASLHVNICLPGMTSVGGSVGGENWCVYADLDAYCDTAAIMSYGMSWAGSAPGPVSPRSWLEGIYSYAANAMNPDKIMMGLPGYGWRWQIYNTREDDSLKRKGIWKRGVVVSGIMLAMNLSGCSFFVKKDSGNTDIQSVRQESENADKTVMKRSKSEEKEAEEILEICSKTYAKAEKEGKLDDLEMIRDLIKELGEKGFTAVDSENQVNMTEYEKLIQFSEKAEAKKNGRMTVVEVAKGGSCIIRNMETHDGIVNMIRSYCIYENGKLKQSSEDIYRTESWEYTEDGHLMFSGRLAFEGSYEVTRNEIMEYMAYRVLSLDETCRELNRKYILPIGYERNNMFLTDWSEEEFAELDFYDMFDLFYQENHTANGEFTFGNAMGTSAVYLISKEKFEPVIKSKFKISSEVLQSKTVYYPCEEVYEYKPRGLEETEYPEYPYPEVIGYVNNDDGTLTLKVQAVFPYRGVSKAYIHEVTVRDTKDGGIQYVGNRIIEPINNPEIRWHVPRLTRTEWEELYGDN